MAKKRKRKEISDEIRGHIFELGIEFWEGCRIQAGEEIKRLERELGKLYKKAG